MTDQLKGLLLTALGVMLVVPDALFVRLIEAEPLVIAFWRGLTSGSLILIAVLSTRHFGSFSGIRRAGWPALIYAVLLGSTTIGFVQAISRTSVANAVLIFAVTPIFAAFYSRVFLGEPLSRRVLLTALVVALGLGLIAFGSGQSETAHWSGDLWALYVAAAYAGALTAVRKVRSVPMIPVVPLAYIGSAAVISIFVDPWPILAEQWPLLLGHGAFIAGATCLLTIGPRYIGAAEVALLILLESALAPVLVWAVLGEDPGRWAVLGGAIVVGSLLATNLLALRQPRGG